MPSWRCGGHDDQLPPGVMTSHTLILCAPVNEPGVAMLVTWRVARPEPRTSTGTSAAAHVDHRVPLGRARGAQRDLAAGRPRASSTEPSGTYIQSETAAKTPSRPAQAERLTVDGHADVARRQGDEHALVLVERARSTGAPRTQGEDLQARCRSTARCRG